MTGILFDLDGTLLNTLEDLLDATNYSLRLRGFPERTPEQLRKAVGNGAANQIRRSLPLGTEESVVQKVLADYLPYYAAHCHGKTRPYRGIPQALEQLSGLYPLAIVSNKPDPAVKALCREFFPGIYAQGEAPGCPRKPAPEMVFRALAAIGAEQGIYVGDSEVDICTAKNAGIPCISVTWGFRDEAALIHSGAGILCRHPECLAECAAAIMEGRKCNGE